MDNKRHKRPNIHVKYQDDEVVIGIPDGELLEGAIPPDLKSPSLMEKPASTTLGPTDRRGCPSC
jgi:hypothetical protein